MPEVAVESLLKTATVTIQDVCCQGSCPEQSVEECATATQLVFPYRGVCCDECAQKLKEAHSATREG